MRHLTCRIKRPKGFKKERTIRKAPDFNSMRPLPIDTNQNHTRSSTTNGQGLLYNQALNDFDPNALRALQLQPRSQLLAQMQRAIDLRLLWLRNELILNAFGRMHVLNRNTNRTSTEQVLCPSLIRTQSNSQGYR